eukprot:TRINITY_DN218_c0_g1_i1.p1 TRINITY_DN218_c0_g1~~TRINITY_DN218_c0_g1_i1.p1  ORF type:complete len:308 (-),score=154.72 TRINITY_DN218_c0_g1_i1:144-1004(-)
MGNKNTKTRSATISSTTSISTSSSTATSRTTTISKKKIEPEIEPEIETEIEIEIEVKPTIEENNNNNNDNDNSNPSPNLKKTKKLTQWKIIKEVEKDERCTICLCDLIDEFSTECVLLSQCKGHYFHADCISQCYDKGYVRCPVCSYIYGTKIGNQPNGTMKYVIVKHLQCSGFNCGTIQISYNFPNGIQNESHPNPRVAYEGTQRTAYLPDNEQGQEVLRLFKIAWERKLLFTVGRSVTTGKDNVVIWNGIHHKTTTEGGPTQFGYPDETYFARVQAELAEFGVV